jgi:hypothetical protein
MPHMSGIEFIGVVRRRFPTLPVIAFFGSMPDEFPAGTEPDRLFEKRGEHLPELMKAINELARRTPDGSRVSQAISVPVRTVPDSGGDFSFSCPDCLRAFMARVAPKAERIATTAACTHCGGHVPFLHETAANA